MSSGDERPGAGGSEAASLSPRWPWGLWGGGFSAVFVSFYLSPGVAQTPSKKDCRCGKKHEDARMPGILENSDLGWPCPELSAMAGMSCSTPSSVVAASNVRLPST